MLKTESKTKAGEHRSALGKALLVLHHVTQSRKPIGLAELVDLVELPRQTVHRVLQQLVDARLILRAMQKDRYVVGPALTQLSVQALNSLNTGTPVRAVLETLVGRTGETCNIGTLDQDEVIYIERMEGSAPLHLQLEVGSRVPVHCTAIGKLLLAHQHKNIRTRLLNSRPLQQFTANTFTDIAVFEEELARIRSQGYSFNNQEYVDGLTAVAVAIRDNKNKVIAALAVHAPSTRMDLEKAQSYLPSMIDMAERISVAWSQADETD